MSNTNTPGPGLRRGLGFLVCPAHKTARAMFTTIAYTVALGWMLFRLGAWGKRTIDLWITNQDTWYWPLVPLGDGPWWSRGIQFTMDVAMSSVGMLFARIAIAGTASAPIGALIGLSCSFMITGGGAYWNYKSKQLHA